MTTFDEYMAFFSAWLDRQFPHAEDAQHNRAMLDKVARIVSDPDELAYFAGHSTWSIYNLINE